MSPARERTPQLCLAVLLLTALGPRAIAMAAAAEPAAATTPESALNACASLVADADRLACYDRLAGRVVPSVAAPVANAPPSVAAPAAAAAAVTRAAAVPATPAAPLTQSFGLYEAEHPKPPPAPAAASLQARVAALGASARGRMTVSLEGGALWELDEADPLLAPGDTVTITRAALGSYILHTPAQRSHRVRRLH